jgi:hypothetical protein
LQPDTLLAMLRQRVKDGRGRHCIEPWRHAGILAGNERGAPATGSPPGAVRSPLLANADLHEGLDTWCATAVQAPGRGQVVRYR